MKRIFSPYCLILLWVIFAGPALHSQNAPVSAVSERIQACTDRTMYVSGENVCFSAVVFHEKDLPEAEASLVFYCELIKPDGNRITGRKIALENSSGQGCLTIPEETISGIYFLKLYTRFMRNAGPGQYKYIMLKIINPHKAEVLSGHDVADTTGNNGNKLEITPEGISVDISTGKTTFLPREEIQLTLNCKKDTTLPARLCLSVFPEPAYCELPVVVQHQPGKADSAIYLPETRGVSLSGHLVVKKTGQPVPGAKINLSVIGDKDIMVARTDSGGRFFFPLPDYTGSRDIFLCADDFQNLIPEILIDNDFCSKPVDLPSPVFTLSEEEIRSAYKLAVNFRVTGNFRVEPEKSDSTAEDLKVSFYGAPSEILVMQKYIDLPTLEEYFSELPVMVKLRKVQGKKQFRFYTAQTDMSIYEPLMLVDWVAVNDIDKILAMSPQDIERVELVNSPYVKGSVTYGGIVSFVSRKNDFAGIDLPTSGTFVNYMFLDDAADTIPAIQPRDRKPDSRNTAYWNPDVRINNDGTSAISFQAPDTPGKYLILLRAMNASGTVVNTAKTIVVEGR